MDKLERYIEEYTRAGTEADNLLLSELERATNLSVIQPKMVSGHVQGAFLTLITKMLRPRLVLEIGTFTGYSALSIAAGLDEDAEIHTVEIDDELEDIARSFFERSSHRIKINQHIGSALDVVPRLAQKLGRSFDMVFIDGDKREYPDYYRMIMGDGNYPSMVRSGSIVLTDNVLWYGKVAEIEHVAEMGKLTENHKQAAEKLHRTENPEKSPKVAKEAEIIGATSPEKSSKEEKIDKHTAGILEFNRMVAADSRVENVILPLRDGINLIRVR